MSGAVILALAAFLTARALSPVEPADLVVLVAPSAARAGAGGWTVALDVRNQGDAAAKEVVVEVAAGAGGTDEARALATLDYLAGGEERRVYAVLAADPGSRRIEARVRSWQEP